MTERYERMKAMCTIVNRGDGLALSKLYAQNGVQLHFQIAASGTASNELLSMLGLTHRDKDMLLGFAPESVIETLLEKLDDDLRSILSVRGIAFSLPLTGISSLIALTYSKPESTEGGNAMHPARDHNLILIAVNQGCTDAVMQTACAAGATGGTVIRGRWSGGEPMEQHHSITLQAEKEILAIACQKDARNAIMDAISKKHGLNSREQAFVCSLPIDSFVRMA